MEQSLNLCFEHFLQTESRQALMIGFSISQWASRCLSGKDSAKRKTGVGSMLGLGRSPGEGDGNPLQYSWLENRMDRGAWQATVHGVAKSQT